MGFATSKVLCPVDEWNSWGAVSFFCPQAFNKSPFRRIRERNRSRCFLRLFFFEFLPIFIILIVSAIISANIILSFFFPRYVVRELCDIGRILCFYFVPWIFSDYYIFVSCVREIFFWIVFRFFFFSLQSIEIVSKWSKVLWFDHVDYLWGIMNLNRAGLEPDWWIILTKLVGVRYNNFYGIIMNNAITCVMWYRYNLYIIYRYKYRHNMI